MPDMALIVADFDAMLQSHIALLGSLPLASEASEDADLEKNSLAEGILLRSLTVYENTIEALFLHYCTGGISTNGYAASTRLNACSHAEARAIIKAGQRYIDWGKPDFIRGRADMFFQNGEPFRGAIDGRSGVLSDVVKVRNMIAHASIEADNAYKSVQRNNFQTERTFILSPGQLLRIRQRKGSVSWGNFYVSSLRDTLLEIAQRSP